MEVPMLDIPQAAFDGSSHVGKPRTKVLYDILRMAATRPKGATALIPDEGQIHVVSSGAEGKDDFAATVYHTGDIVVHYDQRAQAAPTEG
jgi:hypothetical protein